MGGFLLLLVTLVGAAVIAWQPRLLTRRFLGMLGLVFAGLLIFGLGNLLFFTEVLHSPNWFFFFLLFVVLCVLFWWVFKETIRPERVVLWARGCPPVGLLSDLLADRLPTRVQAPLAAHLDSCNACQQQVEGLSGQPSWVGMARKLSEHAPAPEPALRKVMDRLKEDAAEPAHDEPVFAGDLPLGFLTPSDKPGQLGCLGRYEVLEEIGRGGMGVVLKAFDPSLHRVVAIKVLAPQLATSGVARKRFLREARAAAAVSHDHVVTLHAVDEYNGLPYLVMQLVPGCSLQDRIDREGPVELAEIVRIGMQTASGLAAAHAHGIVHRDIKPANILLEEGVQRVKITDFGLARAMDDASLTQSGFVAGSPLYMAPEQARGEAMDHRADLFSLGSVLYTMCTGRPPFRAANTLAVLRRVSEDNPRPIRETNPEVPDWLADVVGQLMARDPADRFQSAFEVEEVLGRHLAQLQHASWVPPPRPPAPSATPDLPTSVTICPSCGANLQVPERMVGSVVHCFECGRPFRVEEGSEVLQVARPAPVPFCPRRLGPRTFPRWLWVVGAGLVLLVLLVSMRSSAARQAALQAREMQLSQERARQQALEARRRLMQEPKATTAAPAREPFWKESLGWLPAEASLFGAFDLPASKPLTLDDKGTQALLHLFLSRKAADALTPENLGRIRVQRVSLSYYEDARPDTAFGILQLEGEALDGRKRILDFLRRQTDNGLQGQDAPFDGAAVRVKSPALPFALGLFNDQRAFLAKSFAPGAGDEQHWRVLQKLPATIPGGVSLNTGYQPLWVRKALAEIPSDACGFLLGEVPAAWCKRLTETLELRVCPRTFVLYALRQTDGYTLFLSLNFDRAGDELRLCQDLGRWRLHGWRDPLARLMGRKFPPKTLEPFADMLNGLRWGTRAGIPCVRTRIEIHGPTYQALSKALQAMAHAVE